MRSTIDGRGDSPVAPESVMRHVVVVAWVAVVLVGCASTPRRPRTPMETGAYEAFGQCWNAGGPPTLEFTAIEERGKLYAVMGHSFGNSVPETKYDAVKACMAERGVTPTWGFPPSMRGGGGRSSIPSDCPPTAAPLGPRLAYGFTARDEATNDISDIYLHATKAECECHRARVKEAITPCELIIMEAPPQRQ